MKFKIIYLISFFLLAVSCQKENKVEFYDLGTEMSISSDGMTSLDNQVVVSVKNPLKNLSSVTIDHKGVLDPDDKDGTTPSGDLGSVTITDGAGSATLTSAQLGVSLVGWTAKLMFNGVFDGKNINRPLNISVKSPFSTENINIKHREDTMYHSKYEIETVSATVTSIKIETKVSSAGAYSERTGTWKNNDSVSFKGADFNIGDTIFVKLTASAGTIMDSAISRVVVGPDSYGKVSTFKLDTTPNQAYDFIMAKEVKASAGDSADIELTSNQIMGGYELGFVSNNNAEFVTVSKAVYADGDMVIAAKTDFGSAIQAVTDLEGGEMYVYRTRRGTGPYKYGYIKVVMVDKPQGVFNDSYVSFELKH